MILKIIVKGKTSGKVTKTDNPINFLATVNKKTGVIQDKNHELYQRSISNSILIFPHGVGSSVGAYTIYSLKSNNCAPLAMICKKADLIVASGCALANIPLVIISKEQFNSLTDGTQLFINTQTQTIS